MVEFDCEMVERVGGVAKIKKRNGWDCIENGSIHVDKFETGPWYDQTYNLHTTKKANAEENTNTEIVPFADTL